MTWTATELIEVILKNLTDRIALAALFIALILIGFAKLAPSTVLGQWITVHIIVFYLIALGAICFLPTRHIIEAVDGGIAGRRKQRNLRKHLDSLGSDDQFLLHNHIVARKMAFKVGSANYHIAKSLEKRGIVYETAFQDFTIDKDVFSYLVEHPELVGAKKAS